ncbi:MAG: antibiotic biosynthesis monooxygenase family protein [Nitrososphaerota archaeon]
MKFARITTAKVPIEKTDEFNRIYEQNIPPALKGVRGFEGVYLLIDRSTGEGFSLTFWESKDDAMAYEQSGLYAQLVDKLRPFFITAPTLKSYEVPVELPALAAVTR